MSTTFSGDLGLVRVLDPPDVIRRKLRSAVTDSGRDVVRSEEKPGVTNLIEIMAVATGEEPEAIEARYDGAGYGKFKEDVGEAVVALFDPIRLRYADLRGNPGELHAILARGAGSTRSPPKRSPRPTSALASFRHKRPLPSTALRTGATARPRLRSPAGSSRGSSTG